MSEPRVDDDIALGKDDSCEDCDERFRDCDCREPDVCYDEYYNDQKGYLCLTMTGITLRDQLESNSS